MATAWQLACGRRLSAVTLALSAALVVSCSQGEPTLTVTDPGHDHEVEVSCEGFEVEDCQSVADELLGSLPNDAANVERIVIEPLADAPVDSRIAARVVLDHEMFLASGEQPYRFIQQADGSIDVAVMTDE